MRIASACAVAAAAILLTACSRAPRQLRFTVEPAALPADGFSRARLIAGAPGASFRIREGRRHARIEGEALVAGVTPGRVVVEAAAPGFMPASARIATEAVYTDAAGDGTPDFLRLDTPRDRAAFRRWFTFLAEAAFLAGPARRPAEITDCAGLVRFAYREALREHDGDWAMSLRLPLPSDAPALMKYRYPYTPLGAGLFRVASGPFVPRDLTG
ncbi:MAG: DUF1175 family protein, partial [Acidobacteria bacterium]|nr:DUF1175 family protein [Acidobacteriota bacterium]